MNKNTLKIHPDLLDKESQEVLLELSIFSKDFVLGGGTALALHLNHRKSFDFDFFSPVEIPGKLLEKLSQRFVVANVAVDSADELTFFTTGNIKITFLYYPFKSIFDQIELVDGLRLFSVKEIALQKAYTIGRRGEYRDYFDLYTVLKNQHISLQKIVDGAKQVFGGAFDEKIFLAQLVYFDDIHNYEIIPVSNKLSITPDQIKQYFEELVETYISK